MDVISPERRSSNMSRIRSTDSLPELLVRSTAHRLGYRFRLHRKDLPGKPDLVFPGRRKILFVHGCFWHQHPGCREGRKPGSNSAYWSPKLDRNVERDRLAQRALREAGWDVLVVWECEAKDVEAVALLLAEFLGPSPHLSLK